MSELRAADLDSVELENALGAPPSGTLPTRRLSRCCSTSATGYPSCSPPT
jgi:hypothetical protein